MVVKLVFQELCKNRLEAKRWVAEPILMVNFWQQTVNETIKEERGRKNKDAIH